MKSDAPVASSNRRRRACKIETGRTSVCTVRSGAYDEADSSHVPTLRVRVLVVREADVTDYCSFTTRLRRSDSESGGFHLALGVIPVPQQYDRIHGFRRLLLDVC